MTNVSGAAIFMIDADKALTALEPTDFVDETAFQELLASHPALLSLAAGSDGDLLLVAREVGVADEEGASDRWSVDHLFLNKEGVPVFVEVKRARDPRARRLVVAQMLDYASHGTAYWSAREIAAKYQEAALDGDAEARLREFLGQQEPDDFWQQVEANLRAGRIRMLFVADKISKELRRIVEFLNEQMRPAEILAVEIAQFMNADGVRTIVPSLVGATERAQSVKTVTAAPAPISAQDWLAGLAKLHGPRIGTIAQHAADFFEEAGLAMRIVPSQKSAAFELRDAAGAPRALFYLLRDSAGLQIGVRNLEKFASFRPESAREAVVNELKALGFSFRSAPADPANSWPTIPLDSLVMDAVWGHLRSCLLSVVSKAKGD